MPRAQNLAESYLSEVVNYGGFPVTRATAYELACQDLGTTKGADWFAFASSVQVLPGAEPLTAAQVREWIEKD